MLFRSLALLSYADMLKINDEEIHVVGAWIGIDSTDTDTILQALLATFPRLQDVILTKGADGAQYYGRTQQFSVSALPIRVQDTIGAGDAFLSGYLAKKLQGATVVEAMQHAALLSAYVATQIGACPNYTKADITTSFR